jgi:hypothetical protein
MGVEGSEEGDEQSVAPSAEPADLGLGGTRAVAASDDRRVA